MYFILLLMILSSAHYADGIECKKIGICGCELSNGKGKYDLSPIDKLAKIPAFTAPFSGGATIRFDPCRKFACGSSTSTNVCYYDVTGLTTPIGSELSYDYIENSKHVNFIYKEKPNTLTYVRMLCSTNEGAGQLIVNQIGDKDNHNFMDLHSKYACLVNSNHSNKLSIGSIICIVFVVVVFLYIVLGCIINKYIRKITTGEHFPNIEFWRQFPSLIKTGCIFTYQQLKKLRKKNEDYNKI